MQIYNIPEYQNQNTINNSNWELCKNKNSFGRIANFQGEFGAENPTS